MLIQTNCILVTVYDHEPDYEKLRAWAGKRGQLLPLPHGMQGFVAVLTAPAFKNFVAEFDLVARDGDAISVTKSMIKFAGTQKSV